MHCGLLWLLCCRLAQGHGISSEQKQEPLHSSQPEYKSLLLPVVDEDAGALVARNTDPAVLGVSEHTPCVWVCLVWCAWACLGVFGEDMDYSNLMMTMMYTTP